MFTQGLKTVKDLNLGQIATGTGAFAAAIITLAIATRIMGDVTKSVAWAVVAVGAAFALMGVGVLAAGKGMQLMTTGFA